MSVTTIRGRSATGRTIGRASDETSTRVVDAALACFAEVGVSKTTVEDVAERAGIARATLYRYFPGKQALLLGVVTAEVRRFQAGLDARLADADTLEDLLVGVLSHLGEEFEAHDALQYVLAVEPEAVLPHISFEGAHRLFATAAVLLAPHLARFLPPDDLPHAGEWVGRVALTYLFCPSERIALARPDTVRFLVRTFVLPGIDPTLPRRG
jgi:AcrR family transcriptional regulator